MSPTQSRATRTQHILTQEYEYRVPSGELVSPEEAGHHSFNGTTRSYVIVSYHHDPHQQDYVKLQVPTYDTDEREYDEITLPRRTWDIIVADAMAITQEKEA